MRKRRNVLIISYHYLPEVMAASFRMYSWAKYLPTYGWQPFILTRSWNSAKPEVIADSFFPPQQEFDADINCVIYRSPHKQTFSRIWNTRKKLSAKHNPTLLDALLRKAVGFLIRSFMIPDEKIGWCESAYKAAVSIIKKHDISIILSTGGPWTDFKVASKASKNTGIPWIADYRDPWTQPTTLGLKKRDIIWFLINRINEIKIAKTASGFIHIARPLQYGLAKMINRKIHLIPNGFDPANFRNLSACNPNSNTFRLSFVGTLHTNTNTDVFFEGFHKFVTTNHLIPGACQIEFIGDTVGHKRIEKSYPRFSTIAKFINFRLTLAQKEAIRRMCQSHVLLSFPLDMEGCCPAKTYEYLASGRPILVSPDGKHRGVIKELLDQTKGGAILNTPEEIADWLHIKFGEFSNTGSVKSTTDLAAVGKYSRKKQVKLLSQILESCAH